MASTPRRTDSAARKTARKPPGTPKRPARRSTRTTSRSAKRRSPKEPEADPEALEYERTEFLRAMDKYKRKTGKTFPSWTEVLEVLRSIGWMHPLRVNELVDRQLGKASRSPSSPSTAS